MQGKRLFIKDLSYHLVPPIGKRVSIAPSLATIKRGVRGPESSSKNLSNDEESAPHPYDTDAELENPTVIPRAILEKFHFTFLIRHPRFSIPSFYRCTVPPLDSMTGFYDYMPSEAGYDELRRVFDYLRSVNLIGPKIAGPIDDKITDNQNGAMRKDPNKIDICVIDADDLLDNPEATISAYCRKVGIDYDPKMLKWDSEVDHQHSREAFEKWKGFHEDAINSTGLRPRQHVSSLRISALIENNHLLKYDY